MVTEELKPLEKNSEELPPFSRFYNQSLFVDKGQKFWGTWQSPMIPESTEDTFHIVTEADVDRIDLIAYRYYNTPELWWVIAEVNSLFFALEDLQPGQVIRIPSYSLLTSLGIIR